MEWFSGLRKWKVLKKRFAVNQSLRGIREKIVFSKKPEKVAEVPALEKGNPYVLNWKVLDEKPIKVLLNGGAETETTFTKLLRLLQEKTIICFFSGIKNYEIECPDEIYSADITDYRQWVLSTLLDIQKRGIKLSSYAQWFLYDTDRSLDWPSSDAYLFFIVSENKIVHERACLFHGSSAPLDFNALENVATTEASWAKEIENEEARAEWLYERFYKETDQGQIISIRNRKRG